MRGLIFSLAVAVLSVLPRWAIAASDQVLRAMYCMSVLDLELAESRKISPELRAEIVTHGVEYYRNLARQRPLTEKEKHELSDVQEFARTGVSDVDRELARNRERLRVYWLSNSDADDGSALMTARQRAGVDFEQCKAENPAFSCTQPCADLCIAGNAPGCFAACEVKCGAPTCARTFACFNPTWLPY